MDVDNLKIWGQTEEKQEYVYFCPPSEALLNNTIDYFYPKPGQFVGYEMPLKRLQGKILLRQHELSIWTGISGHGKSNFLGQVILHCLKQGAKVAIASLELKNHILYSRLMRQASCLERPSLAYIHKINLWLKDKIYIADTVGSVTLDGILNFVSGIIPIFGVDILIIDSLMMLNIAEDDYRKQKEAVGKLCDFKNSHKCHVHLVAHQRKPMDETKPGGKLDVKGSGVITDLADNVFTIWRNKNKEIETYKAAASGFPLDLKTRNSPDGVFICDKQRNGEYEDQVPMWYHKKSLQYVSYATDCPHYYVPFDESTNVDKEFSLF